MKKFYINYLDFDDGEKYEVLDVLDDHDSIAVAYLTQVFACSERKYESKVVLKSAISYLENFDYEVQNHIKNILNEQINKKNSNYITNNVINSGLYREFYEMGQKDIKEYVTRFSLNLMSKCVEDEEGDNIPPIIFITDTEIEEAQTVEEVVEILIKSFTENDFKESLIKAENI